MFKCEFQGPSSVQNSLSNTVHCLALTLIFLLAPLVASASNDDYHSIIRDIRSQVGCSQNDAEAIFLIVNYFSDKLQKSFTYVASSRDPLSKKDIVIQEIISQYFESAYSTIQVSSVTRNTITDYPVGEYLHRLARLQQLYGYIDVKLEFKPNYLGIGKIERIDDSSFELSVSMWQYFYGRRGDGITYIDDTRKKFRLKFNLRSGRVYIKISEIYVAETLPR